MAVAASRKPVMTLYSSPTCLFSHRTRLVLAEKGISFEICDVDPERPPEDLLDLNPYNSVPTLVDRDLVLYDSRVIMEYLDERFPHPPLLPVDPVNRARCRLVLSRIDTDWYEPVQVLEGPKVAAGDDIRRRLRDSLTASTELFGAKEFFLGDEFSLMDCCLAPLLWRLPHFGIELPPQARDIIDYGGRMFGRPSFRRSLSAFERAMRD